MIEGADPRERAKEWFPLVPPDVVSSVRLASEHRGSFVYVDCGAWSGDGVSAPARRDFALVCGRSVLLCEFQAGEHGASLDAFPEQERAPLRRALGALGGPQRQDVTVVAALRAEGAEPAASAAPTCAYALLPELNLPVLTTLPDLHPELVPDPTRATCPCHGPIVTRILYGEQRLAAYRAFGASVSRNPNDWVFLLAQSYEVLARDLLRFVDRLAKLGAAAHIVQLGRAFDVWDGYACMFQGSGRMAWVCPEVRASVSEEELIEKWCAVTHDTPVRSAALKLVRLPRARRTLLHSSLAHGNEDDAPPGAPRSFEVAGVLHAENRPEPMPYCMHKPPLAFFGLLEQRVRLQGWRHTLPPAWRWAVLAAAAERWRKRGFPVYAMAHSGKRALLRVDLVDEAAARGPFTTAHVAGAT